MNRNAFFVMLLLAALPAGLASGQSGPSKALVAARAAAATACDIEIRAYCTGTTGDAALACLRKLSHPVGSRCKSAMDEVDRLAPRK